MSDAAGWNIAGFVFTASTVVWHLGIFYREASHGTDEIQELWTAVQKVRESVRSTRDVLRARNTPSQAELRNHECIKLIVDKCEDELSRLQATLPPPPTGDTSLSELQSHVSLMVSHETARYVVKALELCDTALEVERKLMDIFIMNPSQRAYQRSRVQEQLHSVVQDGSRMLSYRGFNPLDPEWDDRLIDFIQSIRDAALEPPSARSASLDGNGDVDSGIGVDFDAEEEDPIAQSMPAGVIEARSVPTMLVQAKAFMDAGKYKEAARIQKRALSRRVIMSLQTPFLLQERCEMEMRLAEIFRKMANPKSLQMSETILMRLREGVREALDTEPEDEDDEVRASKIFLLSNICYDLGRTCLPLEKLDAACESLNESFEILADILPSPIAELRRSGTVLYRLYLEAGQEQVEILGKYADAAFGIPVKELAWCQAHGYDTDDDGFRFDKCERDVEGLSPLHAAAKYGADDVLPCMLRCGVDIEVRDIMDHMTPFLMACSQQDIVIVDMLIEANASLDARDGDDKTGLLLCQRSEGGTQVARRLLGHPTRPVDVNAMDRFQNTALHLAASKGNIPMVALLLDQGAEPDILGPGGFTPLMAAVEATMKNPATKVGVLEELIRKGADPTKQDVRGLTAADLANDAQIQKMLQKWMKQFQSQKSPKQFPLSPRRFSKFRSHSTSS